MIQRLQLEPSPPESRQEAPAAWFFPGANPAEWLAECIRCGLAHTQTRLYFVPRSVSDPSLLGVLVVPSANTQPTEPPTALPCRRVEGKLLVPLDSRFTPGLLEGEAARLCPYDLAFLHPTAGLSGFDSRSGRSLWELLELPEERPEPWNSAVVGEPGLPAFAGIQIQVEANPEEIFGPTPTAIGKEPPASLPPAPNEPTDHPVAQAGRTLWKSFAQTLGNLLDRLPKTAPKPTWVDTLKGWTQTQVALSESQLDQVRHRELHRLMDLLQRDPDAGLRHAIPIHPNPGRGKAPPSARLGERAPRFDASSLGGGPVDAWTVPDDVLISLRQRYLELANQELQLGRYQRAAYIHANLLGDLSMAANVLKQGRHFREAALLYEHHLNNPTEAGQCYALAGLHEETIRLWTRLELWEQIAELHESLGQREAATEAWRKTANSKHANGDAVGAARILDSKLDQPDAALALLFSTWHASPHAFEPVAEAFHLLGSKGRHTEALERLDWIASSSRLNETDHRVTEFLVAVALRYPDPALRKRAANESLVQLSRLLSRYTLDDPSPAKASEAVIRLWPDDPIFQRDCRRFLELAREQALLKQRQVPATPRSITKGKTFLGRFALPGSSRWLRLENVGLGFLALGMNPTQVWAARGTWAGETQSISWPLPSRTGPIELFHGLSADMAAFGAYGVTPFAVRPFANSAVLRWNCAAGTPPWLPDRTLAILRTDAGYRVLYAHGVSVLLSEYSASGNAGPSLELLNLEEMPAEVFGLPTQKMVAIDSGIAIGFGRHLWLERRGRLQHIDLPEPIVCLIPTRAFTRPGLVVIHAHSCQLLWLGTSESVEITTDVEVQSASLIAPNWLVVSSATEACCYSIDPGQLTERSKWNWESIQVTALAPTGNPHELAALDHSGKIHLYRL